MKQRAAVLAAGALLAAALPLQAEPLSKNVYEIMGLKTKDVLTGPILTSRVLPGLPAVPKQVVAMVTYMTGKREESNAVNVRLEVLRKDGDKLVSLYSRDFGQENGGYVGRGDLELVDLDGDAVNEIIVTYDSYKDSLVTERRAEVLLQDGASFTTAWTGPVEYDATKAVRTVPLERRDRYTRALDIPATLKTRGVTLMVKKTVVAVAGERLEQPKVLQETFPLRGSPPSS
jgi:hypothetical protein